jgi:hypothetical protein
MGGYCSAGVTLFVRHGLVAQWGCMQSRWGGYCGCWHCPARALWTRGDIEVAAGLCAVVTWGTTAGAGIALLE